MLVTPFSRAVVPPPYCAYSLHPPAAVLQVAFTPPAQDHGPAQPPKPASGAAQPAGGDTHGQDPTTNGNVEETQAAGTAEPVADAKPADAPQPVAAAGEPSLLALLLQNERIAIYEYAQGVAPGTGSGAGSGAADATVRTDGGNGFSVTVPTPTCRGVYR